MDIKSKNDVWSVIALVIALFSLLYCFSFVLEWVMNSPAADLLSSLRSLTKGEV
ncbi:hypothetical protein [Planococcus salinus]|uniref:hypothetical protein n=1 Tax=Planococcus salinus TaxID=1848460 RepID=UPI001314DA5A|nr:hypothetical protein [Planococcus salinus]